ncbi:MAG: serine/threonine protein kinase [Kofleriaceae bacterium]
MSSVVAEAGSTANNYQILAKLAVGGMAELFLARAETIGGLSRYVVLKRILRHRASDAHFIEMFLEEARLAAQLQHPNIAQVFDIGKLGDSYFFTMEYVHGDNVRALLHEAHLRKSQLPLGAILTVIAGAAAGLHHAHTRSGWDGRPLGIVHRDVTPSNLMVSFEGNVKVVDFGIAKAEDRALETRAGMVKGKICYLSPEQCLGHPLDRRSDLYSLGIVLWELLTTERLYRHTSDHDNMMAIATSPTTPPSRMRHGLPPEVDELSMRLLAKHPHERYDSAEQVIEVIEAIAARTGTMLSTPALSRLMRELFGTRAEPWLDLETASEPVSVRPEPIPADLTISPDASADLHLDRVHDLSKRRRSSARDHIEQVQPFIDNPPTVATQLLDIGGAPAVSHAPDTDVSTDAAALRPSQQPRHAATTVAASVIIDAAPPPYSPGLPPHAAEPLEHPPLIDNELPAGPAALAWPGPPPVPLPAPLPAIPVPVPVMPVPLPGSRAAPLRRSAGGWRILPLIAVVMMIAAIAALITRTKAKRASVQPSQAVASRDTFSFSPAGDATPAIAPSSAPAIDAAPALSSAPAIDAAPAPVASSPPSPQPAAAAPPVESNPRSATAPQFEPGRLDEPASVRLEPSIAISRAYAAGEYRAVIVLCDRAIPSSRARECFLAACHGKDVARARKWLQLAPATTRSKLQVDCRAAGLDRFSQSPASKLSNRPASRPRAPKPPASKPPAPKPPASKPPASVREECLKDALACPR